MKTQNSLALVCSLLGLFFSCSNDGDIPIVTDSIDEGIPIVTDSIDEDVVEPITLTAENLIESVVENTPSGIAVGQVTASVNSGTIVYSITSQTPTGAVTINKDTGELAVADATLFNYELHTEITGEILVVVEDVSETLQFTIAVENVLDPDIDLVTIDPFLVQENIASGTEIQQAEATTTEGDIVFSLENQSFENAFSIDSTTGIITINDEAAFDFEERPYFTFDVIASVGDFSKSIEVLIEILDEEEGDMASVALENLRVLIQSCRWDISGGGINQVIFETGGNINLNFSLHGGAEWKLESRPEGPFLFVKFGNGDNWDVYEIENIDDKTIKFNLVDKVGETVPIDILYFNDGTIWTKPC